MLHSMEGRFYVGDLWKNIKFPLPNYGGEILCGGLWKNIKFPLSNYGGEILCGGLEFILS